MGDILFVFFEAPEKPATSLDTRSPIRLTKDVVQAFFGLRVGAAFEAVGARLIAPIDPDEEPPFQIAENMMFAFAVVSEAGVVTPA